MMLQNLDGLIDIARLLHVPVVVVNIFRGDPVVVSVEVGQYLEGGASVNYNVGEK